MNRALRGALFSALIFPGFGQILLKSYARGVAFAGVASGCLLVITVEAARQAETALDRILAGGGAVDIDAIAKTARDAASGAGNRFIQAASLLLALSWIGSVIDAYRVGRVADEKEAVAARRGVR